MLSENITNLLNDQLNLEHYCALVYLSASAWCHRNKLCGLAECLYDGAEEEGEDACKLYHHMVEREATIVVKSTDAPQVAFDSIVDVLQYVSAKEKEETEHIHKIYAAALSEGDFGTCYFLNDFVNDQIKEMYHTSTLLERLKMAGGNQAAVLMIDQGVAQKDYEGKDNDNEKEVDEGKGGNPPGAKYTGYSWGGGADKTGGLEPNPGTVGPN